MYKYSIYSHASVTCFTGKKHQTHRKTIALVFDIGSARLLSLSVYILCFSSDDALFGRSNDVILLFDRPLSIPYILVHDTLLLIVGRPGSVGLVFRHSWRCPFFFCFLGIVLFSFVSVVRCSAVGTLFDFLPCFRARSVL